jgi:hypothetical protein
MAKSTGSRKRPQPRHRKKGARSRHDRRSRLDTPNPTRQRTVTARVPLIGGLAEIVRSMAAMLDPRISGRVAILLAGMFLAKGRRTVASWLRGAGIADDWDVFYDALAHIGKKTPAVALPLLGLIVNRFASQADQVLCLAVDDTPTRRYGKHVQGANVHHNPTAGPADSEWVYGHCWVTIAAVVKHARWGTIALPIMSKLYVRQVDVPKLKSECGWEFATKIELAIRLVRQVVANTRLQKREAVVRLVIDGAYACRELLGQMNELGVTVFSRLRSNACLYDVPPARTPGKRGRPRKYGKHRIDLAKKAASDKGWETLQYMCRGVQVTRRIKSFLATTKLAAAPIRVVIVEFESQNWAAYFCTDSTMDVKTILETISDRWAIEEFFHDVKEVWKAGEQQVRRIWSNVACWHMNLWAFALTELECWDSNASTLVDRSRSPWDNADRRPSHADRVRSIRAEMLVKRFSAELQLSPKDDKIRRFIDELLALAA